MTAPLPLVTVEHDGNLATITFHRQPPRPPVHGRPAPGTRSGEEAASTRRRAREWAWLTGLIAGALLAHRYSDHIQQIAHALIGGLR